MRRWILGLCWAILTAVSALSLPLSLSAQGATPEQYYAAANRLYAGKNYAQAAQYYNAAVKLNPNFAMGYQGLGNCYYALGRKADSVQFYERASALQPANTQLAQFVQNLKAQTAGGAASGSAPAAMSPLNQGVALFQQKQYAASIPYFRYAAQQTPNDYRPYYYAGYAYYMTRDAKSAALYFGVANAKQPNASIKNYADRVKASLTPDDQQWVDDQVAKYVQGPGAMASSSYASPKKDTTAFGFHMLGGMYYILADPTQIKQYVTNAQSVSLNGVTPGVSFMGGLEPYVRLGDNLEIGLSGAFIPVGTLSYTTYDIVNTFNGVNNDGVNYKYAYNTNIMTGGLEGKILFGDSKVKAYLGLGADIASVTTSFSKVLVDNAANNGTDLAPVDPSSGDYSTMTFGGHAQFGVDFALGKNISVGPYVGYRYLDATNFKNGGNTLTIRTAAFTDGNGVVHNSGEVGTYSDANTKPLDLDFSAINAGVNFTLSF